jgi:hypothetical protein
MKRDFFIRTLSLLDFDPLRCFTTRFYLFLQVIRLKYHSVASFSSVSFFQYCWLIAAPFPTKLYGVLLKKIAQVHRSLLELIKYQLPYTKVLANAFFVDPDTTTLSGDNCGGPSHVGAPQAIRYLCAEEPYTCRLFSVQSTTWFQDHNLGQGRSAGAGGTGVVLGLLRPRRDLGGRLDRRGAMRRGLAVGSRWRAGWQLCGSGEL